MTDPKRGVRTPIAVFSGGGTGGHLYPALALADALRTALPQTRVVFVGAERGIEARVLPERGEEVFLVPVVGLQRGDLWGNLRGGMALLQALFRVGGLFHRLRPDLVVVTGGYAGAPAGLLAGALHLPLVVQEQNSVPGKVTRLLARWAREIHLAFPEAVERFPPRSRKRCQVTGNPVRVPTKDSREEAARRLGLDPARPVVLIVGGSQGAAALNDAALEGVRSMILGRMPHPGDFQILWVTGPQHVDRVRSELATVAGSPLPEWVHLHGYLDQMPLALAVADLAVSRAGAMATSEFLAWGIPALLIPLPTAAADHQSQNARALEAAGAAEEIPEARLHPEALWARIRDLLEDSPRRNAMAKAALLRGRPEATAKMVESLVGILGSPVPVSVDRRSA